MKKLAFLAVFLLLSGQSWAAPTEESSKPYDYMDEDSEYVKCRQGAVTMSDDEAAICIAAEVKRQEKLIEQVYGWFLQKKQFQDWNNGSNIFSGNVKTMNQQWVAWRNRYCSLYAAAMQEFSESQAYNYQTCLLEQTWAYYKNLINLYRNHDADPD